MEFIVSIWKTPSAPPLHDKSNMSHRSIIILISIPRHQVILYIATRCICNLYMISACTYTALFMFRISCNDEVLHTQEASCTPSGRGKPTNQRKGHTSSDRSTSFHFIPNARDTYTHGFLVCNRYAMKYLFVVVQVAQPKPLKAKVQHSRVLVYHVNAIK